MEFYPGGDPDLRPWLLTIDDLTDEELDQVAEIITQKVCDRDKGRNLD